MEKCFLADSTIPVDAPPRYRIFLSATLKKSPEPEPCRFNPALERVNPNGRLPSTPAQSIRRPGCCPDVPRALGGLMSFDCDAAGGGVHDVPLPA
jgi:hypothetical protein